MDEPSQKSPIEKFLSDNRRNFEILAGFLGWYFFNTLAFGAMRLGWLSYYLVLFWPFITIGLLLIFAIVKRTRRFALGILIAFALNLFIILLLGMFSNALCFFPFYLRLYN